MNKRLQIRFGNKNYIYEKPITKNVSFNKTVYMLMNDFRKDVTDIVNRKKKIMNESPQDISNQYLGNLGELIDRVMVFQSDMDSLLTDFDTMYMGSWVVSDE